MLNVWALLLVWLPAWGGLWWVLLLSRFFGQASWSDGTRDHAQQLDGTMNLVLWPDGALDWAQQPVRPAGCVHKSSRTANWAPWSDRATDSILQMCRNSWLGFLLQWLHQDLSAGWCKACPTSCLPDPSGWTLWIPPVIPMSRTWVGLWWSVLQPWVSWVSTFGSLFPLEKALWVQRCADLGKGWCGQTAPLTFLMLSFSINGVLQSHPQILGFFTVVSYLWTVASWSSGEKDRCRESPMQPSGWHRLLLLFLTVSGTQYFTIKYHTTLIAIWRFIFLTILIIFLVLFY